MVGISQAYSPPINQPYTPHSSAHQAVVVHNITLYGCPWQSQSRCSQSCITCILQKLAYYGNSSIRCVVNDFSTCITAHAQKCEICMTISLLIMPTIQIITSLLDLHNHHIPFGKMERIFLCVLRLISFSGKLG